MNRLILILCFSILYFKIYSKENDFINLLNIYRVYNNSSELIIDSNQNFNYNQFIIKDTIFHNSKIKVNECIVKVNEIIPNKHLKDSFDWFLHKIYNTSYNDEFNDLDRLVKLYMIFLWDNSISHKEIILNKNFTKVNIYLYIDNNIIFKSNQIVLKNKTLSFKEIESRYIIKAFSVLKFN